MLFIFCLVFWLGVENLLLVEAVTRNYYVAVNEVEWNYAPLGFNVIKGRPFGDIENTYVKRGPNRIGSTYKKARYIEFTDATFLHPKIRTAEWEHLGVLGPIFRCAVGDKIEVQLLNNATFNFSMHPHGVFYEKSAEGAPYNDGTVLGDKRDDIVPPGVTYIYEWECRERSGPGPQDPSSIVWLYHSHVDEVADTNSGLYGAIIVTAANKSISSTDPTPNDVDREFVTLFTVTDENASNYLVENIGLFITNGTELGETELQQLTQDEEFEESNVMHNINGFVYGNLQGLNMNLNDRVRWHVIGLGNEVDLHTPHWHGVTVLERGRRADVVNLLPASHVTVDMKPDDPGTWLFHCHVNDHIHAGMLSLFTVNEN
jgi:FtsP/CotA-like multicopper oxidase with cupredoxin domain